MKKIAAVIVLLLCVASLCRAEQIDLRPLDGRESTVRQGTSWGVPFAKGTVQPGSAFAVTDAAGREAGGSWTAGFGGMLKTGAVAAAEYAANAAMEIGQQAFSFCRSCSGRQVRRQHIYDDHLHLIIVNGFRSTYPFSVPHPRTGDSR